jgi:outer membrane protein OmpA-like peptidoglycan-associated protein
MSRFILILWALMATPLLVIADDNCDKAKEVYQQGVNRLNYNERKSTFEQAVKLCPTYAEAYVNLADAYENMAEFEQAEKHYKKAASIKPDLFVPWIGLGELYLKSGRYKDSYDAFLKGMEIKPDNERLKAGLKVAALRVEQGIKFLKCDSIKSCLDADKTFQLMCMCPGDRYEFLRKRICVPTLHFVSGSIRLTDSGKKQITQIGEALQADTLGKKKWLIVGHADSIGSPNRNLELSRLRSESVRDYLVKQYKLDKKSLTTKCLGDTWPLDSNDTSAGQSKNRRVEIILDE